MEPRLYTCFFDPTRVRIPNAISIGSAVFAQLMPKGPYTLQWATRPLKTDHSHGGSGAPFNTWFLAPIRVHDPNGISMGSAVFLQGSRS